MNIGILLFAGLCTDNSSKYDFLVLIFGCPYFALFFFFSYFLITFCFHFCENNGLCQVNSCGY